MPYRTLVTKELAELFTVLSHPARLRIVEELHEGERDVTSLATLLEISQSGVSQHLSLLRSHRFIVERKEGRKVYYRLREPALAVWALNGLQYVGPQQAEVEEFQSAVEKARALWSRTGETS